MTHDPPLDGPITSPAQFETALGHLLIAAAGNDVDPAGSWEYRSDDAGRDWEVMVIELEKPAGGD